MTDNTTLELFWETYFKNPDYAYSFVGKILEATNKNQDLTSLTAYSLLQYLKSHKDANSIIDNFTPVISSELTQFILKKKYQLKLHDELVFVYLQNILSLEDKHLLQHNNLDNPIYKQFENKYSASAPQPDSHEQIINVLGELFKTNNFSFKDAVTFIQQNKLIWDTKINTKKGTLLNEPNVGVLHILGSWTNNSLYENDTTDTHIKEFLRVTSTNINDFYKEYTLKYHFLPWLTKCSSQDEWHAFTSNWENLKTETKQRRAATFLTQDPAPRYVIEEKQILDGFVGFFSNMVTQNTPIDRVVWWTDVFLTDACKYTQTESNSKKIENFSAFSTKQTKLPLNITKNLAAFSEWLLSENKLKEEIYCKIKPILEQYELNHNIEPTYKKNKSIKI